MKSLLLASSVALLSTTVSAEIIIPEGNVGQTENAVITDDGRYFVATTKGLLEIKKFDHSPNAPENNLENCQLTTSNNFYYCTVEETTVNGLPCLLTGLTSDGTYLYGSCTVIDESGSLQAAQGAELFRMLPDDYSSRLSQFDRHAYENPLWYNGMALDDNGDLYMSSSDASYGQASIVKVDLPAPTEVFMPTLSGWLNFSSESLPNGIQIEGNTMYYSTGQKVSAITINDDGSAGVQSTKYTGSYLGLIDDLTITDNHIVVTEIDLYGFGKNSLVLVEKNPAPAPLWCWYNCSTNLKIDTGAIKLSSVVEDKHGDIVEAGALISTSWFQGGIHKHTY